jgi:sarcosine oxidase subunit alpha
MTPIRLTPLHSATQHLGAKFFEMGGWRFPEAYTTPAAEVATARQSVALADVTPHGKLQIEGAAALDAVKAAFRRAPETIGAGLQVEGGHLYRLRPDQFYLSTPPGGEGQAQTHLEAVIAENKWFVTITDLSQALAEMRVIGPNSRDLLSKVCALDFHPDAFPNLTAKQTSLAKTNQLIIRRDFGELPAFTFAGAQSLAAYVWGVVLEAGREFGIVPVGVTALAALEKNP